MSSPTGDAAGIEFSLNDAGIATLTLNRPQRHNALGGPELAAIETHLDQLQSDTRARVLVVSGRGERTFCAGAALDALQSGAISGERFATMTDRLAALPLPTICAFNGSAYGGGVEIGLACDFRIGIESMRLYVPPARIGLCYPVNGIQRFVDVLGVNAAKRLLLASEEFDGAGLQQLGYLTDLVPAAQLATRTRELAERLAGYAPLALRSMKQICDQVAGGRLERQEANRIAAHCNASEDLQEGFRAMSEKRRPQFRGC